MHPQPTPGRNARTLRIVGLCLALAGIAAIVGGLWLGQRAAVRTAEGVGVVVRLVASTGGSVSPIVGFTVDGTAYEFDAGTSGPRGTWAVGQELAIRYDPDDPANGDLTELSTPRLGWTVAGLGGLGLLAGLILIGGARAFTGGR